ncbi:hypothetical protein J2I47_09060 [Fibrella sp. HMF5335]|uniref:Uncharacterized protein n=1 Tax=Fibrella rubiginis TaxID=2817060 RepID=A0A939GE62_9BACT|nr:hypothetical protein [Fibrella rubiginis]MBO0936691.1 hypothetical protein [Fibrella rubiginis]
MHFNSEMGKAGVTDETQLEGLWEYAKEKTTQYGPVAMAAGFGLAAVGSGPLLTGSAIVVGFALGRTMITQVMKGGDRLIREAAKHFSQHGRDPVDAIFSED